MRPYRIGVIGSGRGGGEECALARRVGGAVARAEAILVCGGLGGVMDAAAAGAAAEGGQVLGLLPGEDPSAAAPGVSIPIPTGLGQARNVLVVRASEAVIAMAGGWGTLSEAAFCLKLGVPLLGLRCGLPDEFAIPRFEDPAAAVARALELARAGRPEPAQARP
ncbi:MAG: LOG family protein [Gemmatimonadota bacterium]